MGTNIGSPDEALWPKFGVGLLVLLILDGTWITVATKSLGIYPRSSLSTAESILCVATYNVITAFIVALIDSTTLEDHCLAAFISAGWVYGTFNLTSLATNESWTLGISCIDMVAGVSVYQVLFLSTKLVGDAVAQ